MNKKVGYFFISFIPIIAALFAEFLSTFFLEGVGTLFCYYTSSSNAIAESRLNTLTTELDFNYCIMVLYAIMCICLFGIWYYCQFAGDYLPNPRRTFHPMMLGAIVLLVPGSQFGASIITSILATIFPSWMDQYNELIDNAGLTDENTFLLILYSVILAPICEELIFRGVTMRSFRRVVPFWAANVMQAVLFGVFHGNWIQGFYAGAFGLVLGYVCEKGGSIYYSIFLHILFNFWGTILTDLPVFENETVYTILFILSIFIAFPGGFAMFHFGQKKLARKNSPSSLS